MKAKPVVADEIEASTELTSPECARSLVGYRVSGDIEVRAKELEQELVEMRSRIHALEHEIFAVRRKERARRALSATSTGGLGASMGTVIAMLAYGFDVISRPTMIFAIVLVGFVFGALFGMRWEPPNDDFPEAPPPRIVRPPGS